MRDFLFLSGVAAVAGAVVGVAAFQLGKLVKLHKAASSVIAVLVMLPGSVLGVGGWMSWMDRISPSMSDAANYVWLAVVMIVAPVACLAAGIFGAGVAQRR